MERAMYNRIYIITLDVIVFLKERKMKRNLALIFAVIIGLAVSGCASTSQPIGTVVLPVVTVRNDTGYTGYYLYLSPVSTDDWEEELLGDSFLKTGESIRVTLAYPLSKENRYDFKMIDEDGDSYIKWDIHLTENAQVTFTLKDIVAD